MGAFQTEICSKALLNINVITRKTGSFPEKWCLKKYENYYNYNLLGITSNGN